MADHTDDVDGQLPDGPPPGWYLDPAGSGRWRWWDGHSWTDQTRPVDWRERYALGLAALVRALGGLAAVVTIVVILIAVISGRPVDHASLLLVPGVPLLVGGQLYTIVVLQQRFPRQRGKRSSAPPPGSSWNSFQQMLSPLPVKVAVVAAVLFIGAWLEGITAFPALTSGSPSPPTLRCRYPLVDHGVVSCVSAAAYRAAGVAGVRFAGGVLLGFFTFHCFVAWSELARRRGSGPEPPAEL